MLKGLTVERFQQLGLSFGGAGSSHKLHALVLQAYLQITSESNSLSYELLNQFESSLGFETNIIYFLFQECIYCNGDSNPTNWAAERKRSPEFTSDITKLTNDQKFLFTGEMVFPSMLKDHSELNPLAKLTELLHSQTKWSQIYNLETLKKIKFDELPIVAAMYFDDQYVDFQLGLNDLKYFEFKKFVTNQLFHNGLRVQTDLVLDTLFGIIENGEYI
ncbi:unnamed protein product [Ambrosiozyma monospora]|uniref:Unnamed protein product n=1 Tax=Ambrosiozyma monospora TaxID=43982 RepID=A0ACB5TB11_AMBMO|nr:unnamed protein product [Ambrosiozyma monospora]